jgi:hypothetical protein
MAFRALVEAAKVRARDGNMTEIRQLKLRWAPERFKTPTSVGGLPPWRLSPHQRRFKDC